MAATVQKRHSREITTSLLDGDDSQLASLLCTSGHILLAKVLKTMAGALFNAFTSNYSRDVNSKTHGKRKSGDGVATRDQNRDKRVKLTGGKGS